MLKKLLLLFSIIVVFVCCNSNKNLPTEPETTEIKTKFTKSIERPAKNDFEKNIIYKAESVYPERDSILAYALPAFHKYIPDSNAWFYSSFDGILIPYAITASSISYYSNLIDSLSANDGYDIFKSANFKYSARVDFNESYTFEGNNPVTDKPFPSVSYERVFVVKMSLEWENYCGELCALWISHKRIVVFDESGNLLNVFYDNLFPVVVS